MSEVPKKNRRPNSITTGLLLGSRIPSPHWEYLNDPKIRYLRTRRCGTCYYEYRTAEIPLATNWDGLTATCCPIHYWPGSTKTRVTMEMALTGGYESRGLLRAMTMGAVYRRVECRLCARCHHPISRHKEGGCTPRTKWNSKWAATRDVDPDAQYLCGCPGPVPCIKDGKKVRWSTLEVSSEGIVVNDVVACPVCGAPALALAHSQCRQGPRVAQVRHYARAVGRVIPTPEFSYLGHALNQHAMEAEHDPEVLEGSDTDSDKPSESEPSGQD